MDVTDTITGDISNNFESVLSLLDQQLDIVDASGPGGWNDPDMVSATL
jgi:alpha-galactosidase